MKKRLVLLVVLTFIISILTVGCQNTAQQRPLNPNQNNMNQTDTTTPGTLSDRELRAMAERLEDLAEEVRGVDDASVLISDMSTMDNTGLGNNAGTGNNIPPNPGLGTGTGDNNMGRTGIRDNTGNNNTGNTGVRDNTRNNNMGDTITRDNTRDNENIGNPNPNPDMNNNDVGRTNGGGLPGITENINTRFINNNNNMNNTTNTTQGLVVMVGIELEDNYKNTATSAETIQREVANKIKASDNRISQVYVTTDESMVKRIEDVVDDVEDGGGALKTLRNEINKIYRELVNQGPAF